MCHNKKIPFYQIINLIAHAPLWRMVCKKVNNLSQRSNIINLKLDMCHI